MRSYVLLRFVLQFFVIGIFSGAIYAGNTLDKFTHSMRPVTVYKSPTCGCCEAWVQHIKAAGFQTRVQESDNLNQLKKDLGLQPQYQACHTAAFKGYVFEGHVPASIIQHFLTQAPDALGLSVPGMPMGSPGMDNGRPFQDYQVLILNKDGSSEVYATVSNDGISYR
ncbi:MAG: DUF411 domain-containing protein [Cellvibrionaceae bacterium]